MTLEQFNKQYKYKTDKDKFGFFEVWDIPELQDDGFYYGDCEDYAIFLKHNIEQFENWSYYYCTLDGVGHCVLIKGNSIIDCNCQSIMLLDRYKEMYNIDNLKQYGIFTIFSKFVFGKLNNVIIKIKRGLNDR